MIFRKQIKMQWTLKLLGQRKQPTLDLQGGPCGSGTRVLSIACSSCGVLACSLLRHGLRVEHCIKQVYDAHKVNRDWRSCSL